MLFTDDKQLNILGLDYIIKAETPPVGTHIRRLQHDYSYDRLFCNFNAGSIQKWNGGQIDVGDGNVVLIPRNVIYTDDITSDGYSIIAYIDLSCELPYGIYKWEFSNTVEPKQRFSALLNIWKQRKTGYYVNCMRELYSIIGMLIRADESQYVCSDKAAAILPAVEYMKANFNDPELTIPSLAVRCNISYSHFRKMFYEINNVSASAYLQKLRVDHACQLLKLGDYSISQAAHMSGFQDVYYFSSFFKRHIGISPTEYRNKYRGK